MSNRTRVPVAEGLLAGLEEHPRLIASRRRDNGALSFPAEPANEEVEEILLSPTGTLFTWTTQEFVPPAPPYTGDTDPAAFSSYAVGYVELSEGILVEGRLTESDPERLAIGQQMKLVVLPFKVEPSADGEPDREIVTFAFAPVTAEEVGA